MKLKVKILMNYLIH